MLAADLLPDPRPRNVAEGTKRGVDREDKGKGKDKDNVRLFWAKSGSDQQDEGLFFDPLSRTKVCCGYRRPGDDSGLCCLKETLTFCRQKYGLREHAFVTGLNSFPQNSGLVTLEGSRDKRSAGSTVLGRRLE